MRRLPRISQTYILGYFISKYEDSRAFRIAIWTMAIVWAGMCTFLLVRDKIEDNAREKAQQEQQAAQQYSE